jgi:hypothetical protein
MIHFPIRQQGGARPCGRGKGVAGMAKIMKMQMAQAGRVARPVP